MYHRVNILSFPHKAYRAALNHLTELVTSTDLDDDAALEGTIEFVHELGQQLAYHANLEDEYLQPMYDLYLDEELAQMLREQHERLEVMYAHLERVADSMQSSADRAETWFELHVVAHYFVSDYLAHLIYEDFRCMPTLWEHLTDEQLRDIQRRLAPHIHPSMMPFNLRFGLRALTPKERFNLMSGLQRSLPLDAYTDVRCIALEVLRGEEWHSETEENGTEANSKR